MNELKAAADRVRRVDGEHWCDIYGQPHSGAGFKECERLFNLDCQLVARAYLALLNRAERMEAALKRMCNECRRYLEERAISEAHDNDPNYISPLKQAADALEEQPT